MGKYVDDIVNELQTRGRQISLTEEEITTIKDILFKHFVQNGKETIQLDRREFDIGFGYRESGYYVPAMVVPKNKYYAFVEWLKENGFIFHKEGNFDGYITYF